MERRLLSLILLAVTFVAMLPAQSARALDPLPNLTYMPSVMRSITVQRIGPFRAQVTAIAYDPSNPQIIYAGAWGSGVFKSQDGGQTWAWSGTGLTNTLVQSLVVAPSNPQVIYAGMYYDDASLNNGVFKSVDGGNSWSPTGIMTNIFNGQAISQPVVYSLAVDPKDFNVVYAGTRMKSLSPDPTVLGGGGVFRTTNGGQLWKPVNTNLPVSDLYVYDVAVDPNQTNRIYAALHQSGVYRSDNQGSTWQSMNAYMPPDPNGIVSSGRSIVVNPTNPQEIFYATWHGQGIFHSPNAGVSWNYDGLAGSKILFLALDPRSPDTIFATASPTGLYRSTNSGATWYLVEGSRTYYRAAVNPVNGNNVTVGAGLDGVIRSTDGGASWASSNWGLTGLSITALAASPLQPAVLYAATWGSGIMKSTNQGSSWTDASRGLGSQNVYALAIDPKNAAVIYAATDSAGVYLSTNSGTNWSPVTGGLPAPDLAAAQSLPNDNRVLPSPEPGTDVTAEIAPAAAPFAPARALAISPTDSTLQLVATAGRGIFRRSSGAAWATTSFSAGTAFGLLFDRAETNKVYAGVDAASGSLLVSTDGGLTWTPSNNGIAGKVVYSLSQNSGTPGVLFAGTNLGVYRSLDGGATWALFGLDGQSTSVVMANPANDQAAFAGASTTGLALIVDGQPGQSLVPNLANLGIQAILTDPVDPHQLLVATRHGGILVVK